jgi:uracil-DNA glycosylase
MAKKKPATAAELIPTKTSLESLRGAAKDCKACDLWERGTQTVFGAGARKSRIMFVGEQPGNDEDVEGKPFVGPAGRLLNEAMSEAGIDRDQVYVTNVVKHFKWEPRGKRRIHVKPNAVEIAACRPWLEAEIAAVKPELIVCLGATAAQALIGKEFCVSKQRGELLPSPWGIRIAATVHPSSVLRAPDDDTRRTEKKRFIEDLIRIIHSLKCTCPLLSGIIGSL